jgi:hypothetical protein
MLGIFKTIFGRNPDDLKPEETAAKRRLQQLRDKRSAAPNQVTEGDETAASFRDMVQVRAHEGVSPFNVWTGVEGKAQSLGITNRSMVKPYKGGAFGFSENPMADEIDQLNRENFAESSEKKKSQYDLGRTALANLLARHGQIVRDLDPEPVPGSSGQYDVVKETVLASEWNANDALFSGTGLYCEHSDTVTLPARPARNADQAKCFGAPVDLNKLEKPKQSPPAAPAPSEEEEDFVDEVMFHYDNSESLFDEPGLLEIELPETVKEVSVPEAARSGTAKPPAAILKPASPAQIAAKSSQATNKPNSSSQTAKAAKPKELTRIEDPASTPRTKEEKKNLLLSDLCDSMQIKQFSHPYDRFSESSLKLIAQNPKTPTGALAWLAAHRDPHIRAAVAKNPSTPIETYWVLARDHEASIRYSIAENLYMRPEILRELSRDRNPLIATTAQSSLHSVRETIMNALPPSSLIEKKNSESTPHKATTSASVSEAEPTKPEQLGDEEFLLMIAHKTTTPPRRLKDLANHVESTIRGAVAENPNTPSEVLWQMARDTDPTVKIKLAKNCNLPEEILDILKEDRDAYVAKAALKVQSKLAELKFTKDIGRNEVRHILTWP